LQSETSWRRSYRSLACTSEDAIFSRRFYRPVAVRAHLPLNRKRQKSAVSAHPPCGIESLEPRTLFSESATAQIALVSTSGTNANPVFHYNITVTDTGTTNVGTLWFGWLPGNDLLPSLPSAVSNPTGWGNMLTGSHNSTDGTAIEWQAASNAITPGNSLSGFDFTTTDSPAALAANSPSHPIYPATMSFVYSGPAFSDAGFELVATPPAANAASITSLASSNTATTTGASVTFTATIASATGSGPVPTGTVIFTQDGNTLGSSSVLPNGTAALTTSVLPAGADHITATYGGDSNYTGSASSPLTETITPPANAIATMTALQATAPSVAPGSPVTFTATVVPGSAGPAPTGIVIFTENGSTLGSAPVQSNGIATLSTSSLDAGSDSIVAAYGGDAVYANSASAPLAEAIVAPAAIVPTIAKSTLPTSLVAGQAVNGSVTVDLTDQSGAIVKGKSTVEIFASTTGAIDGSSTLLAQASHILVITTARPSVLTLPIHIRAGELSAGAYMLFAREIDPSQTASDSPAGPALTAAAPFIALAETLVRSTLPSSATSNAKTAGAVTLDLTNTGDITTTGVTTISLQATPSGVLDASAIQLASATFPQRIHAGKSARATIAFKQLPTIAAGAYTIVAKVVDANGDVSSVLVGPMTITA
jgi:hypothetical protein